MAAPPASQQPASPTDSAASASLSSPFLASSSSARPTTTAGGTPGKATGTAAAAAAKASLASSGWPAAYPNGWEDDDQMAIYFADMQPLPLGGSMSGGASNAASRARAERVRFWTEAIELFLEARSVRTHSIARLMRFSSSSSSGWFM
jgi:hypothetical protein